MQRKGEISTATGIMQTSSYIIHGLLVLAQLVSASPKSLDIIPCDGDDEANTVINRSCFGEDFIFGTGSSAYQFEGAANERGKGASIWDSFTHTYRDKIEDGSNGDVAVDSYHRYKEDVLILKEMGVDAFRFSISWSRVLPRGNLRHGVNMEGIKYYNNLIEELLSNGITPFVTLLHFDIPQALQNQYGGFLNRQIVDDFRNYAELCFKEFGDRVKHWITINEPWTLSVMGYANCDLAPCRCSSWEKQDNKPKCTGGDSSTEPYIVAHHQILAHAAAVQVYREKYQACQGGKIGMTLHIMWFLPFSNEEKDVEATERALGFMAGWFLEPMTFGHYPSSMRSLLHKRGIPMFTEEETALLKGSFDFLGINYYTSRYVQNNVSKIHEGYFNDMNADLLVKGINDTPIGEKGASSWLYVYPRGIEDLLVYLKKNYGDPVVYITENGYDEYDDGTTAIWDALADKKRVNYIQKHLFFLLCAMKAGVKVKGYFAWSFLDNFEWIHGYRLRFGLNYVDYKNGLRRYPKVSATWFKIFLENTSQSSKSQILDDQ